MRTTLLAAGLILASAATAQANDPWSGPYVGGGLALTAFDDVLASQSAAVNGVPVATTGPRALTGHVFGGYRWNSGALVWGGEAELQIGNGSFGPGACGAGPVACAAAGLFGQVGTTGRIRLVAGYALDDQTLVFGSAGFTAARVNIDGVYAAANTPSGQALAIASIDGGLSETATGYSLGLGLERMLSERLSMQFGILYDRLNTNSGGNSFSASASSTDDTDTAQAAAILDDNLGLRNLSVRLSVVMRF